MKILLSPAKSIDFNVKVKTNEVSMPVFLNEAEYLVNKLKKMSAGQISKMMSVSADIADLNVDRYLKWNLPFNEDNSRPAADIFTGAAYQGLLFSTLNAEDRAYGQKVLRILSGLYGVLKPLDLIQPYRLEMGTSFKVTPKKKNLYTFWDNKLIDHLNEEIKNDGDSLLVNLASKEYFKAAKLNSINANVVTPVFKDMSKSGEYKVIMAFAKKARGLMTRHILTERIDNIDGLKSFNAEGYQFFQQESTDKELVFKRG